MHAIEVFVDKGGREGFSDNRIFHGKISMQVSFFSFMLKADHAHLWSYLVTQKHFLISFLDKFFIILFLEY